MNGCKLQFLTSLGPYKLAMRSHGKSFTLFSGFGDRYWRVGQDVGKNYQSFRAAAQSREIPSDLIRLQTGITIVVRQEQKPSCFGRRVHDLQRQAFYDKDTHPL